MYVTFICRMVLHFCEWTRHFVLLEDPGGGLESAAEMQAHTLFISGTQNNIRSHTTVIYEV
jgi:hypothetical protein